MSGENAYILAWDLSHIEDVETDASLMRFPGSSQVIRLVKPDNFVIPQPVYFEANFDVLKRTDFPYNDVNWPLMSQRMIDVLTDVGKFAFNQIEVVMIDDTVHPNKRTDADGNYYPHILNMDFSGVELLEYADAFDKQKSVYEVDDLFPDSLRIKNLQLTPPADGYPPLFRISEAPLTIFISETAKIACESAGLHGIDFRTLDTFI